jgi:AraC-like DNA-binding protein
MVRGEHLVLREQTVPPSAEWKAEGGGWVFVRIHAGEGLLLLATSTHLLNPSDVFVCGPTHACHVRASILAGMQLDYFQVRSDSLVGVLSAFEQQQLTALSSRPEQSVRWFRGDSDVARRFENLCEQSMPALKRRCQMLELAAPILCEHLPARTPPCNGALSAKDRFDALFREMPQAELQYRKPEELANRCGCGVRHFRRLFREHFGHSLVPKRTELRIDKAKQLLVETDAKIINVALDCGFQHVSFFTSTFHRHTRMTPSQYRRCKRRAK